MSTKLTVNLTDRTRSAVRSGESLSGRLNRIADRYLEIVRFYASGLREQFGADDWASLMEAARTITERAEPTDAVDAQATVVQLLGGNSTPLGRRVADLSDGEFFALLELLESDLLADRVGNTR